jgi:hypothetical protein
MTVTPLHAHPVHRDPPSPIQRTIRPTRRLRSAQTPSWTLTVEVTVHGDLIDPDALAVLHDLQRLAARPDAEPIGHLDDRPLIQIYPESRAVLQGERPLALSRLEFDLLLFLAENPGRVFSRDHLLARVWGVQRTIDRTVDVHIRRLRAKAGEAPLVTTVRGVGYRLADDARVLVLRA